MAPRILILSASVGAGHLRAAEAVQAALRVVAPEAAVSNVDVMELTNRVFRRFYAKSYIDLVNNAPHLLGHFYDALDRPSRSGKNRGDRLRMLVQKWNLGKFIRFLKSQPWDLIINTHFLPAEMIAHLRKQGELAAAQVTVTTDFETHRIWVNQPCERYFTATDEGSVYLQSWGVPATDIVATGIPVLPAFAGPHDRAALLARHRLADDRPIVLQMAGGFGVGPIEQLYKAILNVEVPLQIVAVAGRNEELKQKLGALTCPERHRAKVIGFTKEIHELMAVADLVVSKPGGLTTSEALASGAVMVVVNPVPGQETRNSDFLLENGAAIKVNHPALLSYKMTKLLNDPKRLQQLRANVRRVARPNAAFDVARKSLELIGATNHRGTEDTEKIEDRGSRIEDRG
jgi:processive 1,2-diacylglycerol beta-glucosyltransferase